MRKKRTNAWTALLCLIAVFFTGTLAVPGKAHAQIPEQDRNAVAIEKAAGWLLEQKQENGGFGDLRLINDTCDVAGVLELEGSLAEIPSLAEPLSKKETLNQDMKARLAAAGKDQREAAALLEEQNPDGGFGLTGEYASSLWDTLLVLEAMNETGLSKESPDAAARCVSYLLRQQREDGSYGLHSKAPSDRGLTARLSYAVVLSGMQSGGLGEIAAPALGKTDQYLSRTEETAYSRETLKEALWSFRYLRERGLVTEEDVLYTQLPALQKENGSYFDDLSLTALALRVLKTRKPFLELQEMQSTLRRTTVSVGEEVSLTATTRIHYQAGRSTERSFRMELLYGDTQISETTRLLTFPMGTGQELTTETSLTAIPEAAGEYTVRLCLLEGEEILWEERLPVTARQREEQSLTLETTVQEGEDYGIRLAWNGLSSEEGEPYGYRIWRKQEEKEWETRSSWNGEEKVKVLNIYPCAQAEGYLREWMERPLGENGEPAGKHLFEIETVALDAFNRNPEAYLKDSEGNDRYDVLVFGIYDDNAGKDLSVLGAEATQRFIDTGRGVLFGHDTVRMDSPNFQRFAGQLGMKVAYHNIPNYTSRQVEVINDGIVTSYPWKLSGLLEIPETHTLSQYAGGSLPGTVWMRLSVAENFTDGVTGARNDAYLSGNNQLAMIQTGHSSGQATDDERKVLANTLFSLKQRTTDTTLEDVSFADRTAPEVPEVTVGSPEVKEDGCQISIGLAARENGTTYQYYVEGLNRGISGGGSVVSQPVEASACSGISGYRIRLEETGREEEPLFEGIISAQGETTPWEAGGLEAGKSYLLRTWAVDHAGNVSEERQTMLNLEGVAGIPELHAEIQTEENIYQTAQEVRLALSLETPEEGLALTGTLEITDEDQEIVERTEGLLAAPLSGEAWKEHRSLNSKILFSGTYTARVCWYSNGVLAKEASCRFQITADGSLQNQILAEPAGTREESLVLLTSRISNTSSNQREEGLRRQLRIYGEEETLWYEKTEDLPQLQAGERKEINETIPTGDWEAGTYRAVEVLFREETELCRDEAVFPITGETAPELTGSLAVQTVAERPEQLQLLGTITAAAAKVSLPLKVTACHLKTRQETILYQDTLELAPGEEGKIEQETDLSSWEEGDYLLVLTAGPEGDETILDTRIFQKQAQAVAFPEDLVLLAGEGGILLECSQAEINGRTLSGGDVIFHGNLLKMGDITAAGAVFTEGTAELGQKEEYAVAPLWYDGTEGLTETEGSLPVEAQSTLLEQDFIKREGITIRTVELKTAAGTPVLLCSLEGDLLIEASLMEFTGVLYAPNGIVRIQDSICRFNGVIIAKEIQLGGSLFSLNR